MHWQYHFCFLVECHAYFQQKKLQAYCNSKGTIIGILIMYYLCYIGIAFEAYAPIGSPGRFGIQDTDPVVLEDPVVQEIATKHNATPAQVLLNQ